MKQKNIDPAAVARCRAKEVLPIAVGPATISPNAGADNQAVLKALHTHPTKPGFWLVELAGHPEFTIRDAKLRSLKRFRKVLQFRFGITFDCESQDVWQARVEAAIREGGVA